MVRQLNSTPKNKFVSHTLRSFFTGEIKMKRNGEQEISLFHVERDVPYWWFFDLYGSTAAIRAFISNVESPERRNNCAVDNGISASSKVHTF